MKQNYGLILVTGPTGSGKTTTVYSMLNTLNSPSKKIITIEDPVEYELPGIEQSQINEKK
ncbi:Flp pilus assembly complex ATPase component TadA [Patescibacteria group bacterium]|nr:Flp pilus assembly complex ATPase component TadA [Patescibacteria group bacterium]